MKDRIGCLASMTPLPRQKARRCLIIFDWHRDESPRCSKDGKPKASLTCRHFGIHRSYFHRWDKHFDRCRLPTLEDRPTPCRGKGREPSYSRELACKVREIRRADPTFSAKKIRSSC